MRITITELRREIRRILSEANATLSPGDEKRLEGPFRYEQVFALFKQDYNDRQNYADLIRDNMKIDKYFFGEQYNYWVLRSGSDVEMLMAIHNSDNTYRDSMRAGKTRHMAIDFHDIKSAENTPVKMLDLTDEQHTNIKEMIRNKKNPPPNVFEKIVSYIGGTIADIFGEDPHSYRDTSLGGTRSHGELYRSRYGSNK